MTPGQNLGKIALGGDAPLVLIAGPCVIESRDHCLMLAERLAAMAEDLRIPLVFKASFDKANRSRRDAFRGPGLDAGLRILEDVRAQTNLPLLTDVHAAQQAPDVAAVVDVLQIPAFLCRQTDLIEACAATGKALNIKKGQFVAPRDCKHMLDKARAAGATELSLTERGTSFGYHNLVVDMRGLASMRELGVPVIFDATHSVQLPGAADGASGGERQFVPLLARAAVAAGVDALYVEVHDDPPQAKSDAANALDLDSLKRLWPVLVQLDGVVREVRHRPGSSG